MTTSHDTERPGPDTIELVGGALCLDLANTVEGRGGPDRRDAITDAGDLIAWSRRSGALSEEDAAAIATGSVSDTIALERSLTEVFALREAIYRIFTAIADGRAPAEADLEILRLTHADGLLHARLAPGSDDGASDHFAWQWDERGAITLDSVRWRASASAVDLLRYGRLDRLRQCPGGGEGPCNWLFIDTTRGGNRRWCSMSDCGSRSKWTRQNARRRASAR